MKHLSVCTILSSVILLGLQPSSEAALIDPTDVVNNWSQVESPSRGLDDGLGFQVAGAEVQAATNNDGSLISDFASSGNFSFSTRIRPFGGDDDTVGVLFNYLNPANHYRVGWEKGGSPDGPSSLGAGGTDARGLWFVKEEAGVGSILFNQLTPLWVLGTSYDFLVSRVGNIISFSIDEVGGGQIAAASVADTTFSGGNVGIFAESQTAGFSLIDFEEARNGVPEPTTLVLLVFGVAGLEYSRRHKGYRTRGFSK